MYSRVFELCVLMSAKKQLCVLILIYFETWVHIAIFLHSWVQKNGYVYSWVQKNGYVYSWVQNNSYVYSWKRKLETNWSWALASSGQALLARLLLYLCLLCFLYFGMRFESFGLVISLKLLTWNIEGLKRTSSIWNILSLWRPQTSCF